MRDKPTYVGFEQDKYHWKPDVDYKQNPLEYRIVKPLNEISYTLNLYTGFLYQKTPK